MGLTERHWFEDEKPELTEKQLEDILWENNKIFERGYQKGFSDGKSAMLREQEPRVMTLEEVIKHYSLPPVFVDDLSAQEDYLEDIAPLYFDFPVADSFAVHWRGYHSVSRYLDEWKASYGMKWRCWTARPTDEQREAVKWDG